MTTQPPTLGLVSNCWRAQFEQGEPLDRLIEQAVERGFRAVELRQGSLGDYEQAAADAHTSNLNRQRWAGLAARFPLVQFNLAVSLPLFSAEPLTESDPRIRSARATARALAGHDEPHWRIVDTETTAAQVEQSAIDRAVEYLVRLTAPDAAAPGWLSIEHAYQNWKIFRQTIERARRQLADPQRPGLAGRLRICLDPCNLLLTEPAESIPAIVESLESGDVSMVHFKQRRETVIQPVVGAGDVNWPRLRPLLKSKFASVPSLFEVAPHRDLWENLQRSVQYLFEPD